MKIRFSIDPEFCGPVSVGTVDLITLVRDRCDIGLAAAKSIIDRAVFDGETVDLDVPDDCDANNLLADMHDLDSSAVIHAELVA